jgi:hypothetical protein
MISSGIARIEPRLVHLDLHMRVEPGDRLARALDLGDADARRVVRDLPLQIVERDRIVIDDTDAADAGGPRYIKTGEPSPPAPTTSTRAAFSFCCPCPPTSRRTRWRL